jgi:methyl-accepting chemotaxis protein
VPRDDYSGEYSARYSPPAQPPGDWGCAFSTKGLEMADETLIELSKGLARMEAKMENVVETMKTMESEVKELKALSQEASGASKATKAIWAGLGVLLGVGGGEVGQLLQQLLNSAGN